MKPKYITLLFIGIVVFLIGFFVVSHIKKVQDRELAAKAAEEKATQQEVQRKKDLANCLAEQDAALQASIKNACANHGVLENCTPSEDEMKQITDRIQQNKDYCRIKFSVQNN